MKLMLNGEAHEAAGTLTLQQLVDTINPGGGRVAGDDEWHAISASARTRIRTPAS